MITVIGIDKVSHDFFDVTNALEFMTRQVSVREVMCDTEAESDAIIAGKNNVCIVSLTRNWASVRDS